MTLGLLRPRWSPWLEQFKGASGTHSCGKFILFLSTWTATSNTVVVYHPGSSISPYRDWTQATAIKVLTIRPSEKKLLTQQSSGGQHTSSKSNTDSTCSLPSLHCIVSLFKSWWKHLHLGIVLQMHFWVALESAAHKSGLKQEVLYVIQAPIVCSTYKLNLQLEVKNRRSPWCFWARLPIRIPIRIFYWRLGILHGTHVSAVWTGYDVTAYLCT